MKFALLFLYTGLTLGVRSFHLENPSGNEGLINISQLRQNDIEHQVSSLTWNVIDIFLRRLQQFAPTLEVDPRLKAYFNSAQCKSLYGLEKRVGLIKTASRYFQSLEGITGRDATHVEEITSEHFMSELSAIPLPKFALSRLKKDVDRLFTLLSTRKGVETNTKIREFNRRWKNLIKNLKSRRNPSRAYQQMREHLQRYLREADKLRIPLDFNSKKRLQTSKTPTQQQIPVKEQQQEEKIVTNPVSSTVRSIEFVDHLETPSKIQIIPIDESSNTDDTDKRYSSEQTQNTDYVEPSLMSVMEIVKDLIKLTLNIHVPTNELNRIFSDFQNKYKSQENTNPDLSTFTNTVTKIITNADKNTDVKASAMESPNTNSITNIIKNSTFNERNNTVIQNSSQFPLDQSHQQLPLKKQEQEEGAVKEPASSTESYIELVEPTLPSQSFTNVGNTIRYLDELVIPQNTELIVTSNQIQGTVAEQASNVDDSERISILEQISTPGESESTDYTETSFASVMKSITDLLKFNLNLNVPTIELARIFSNLPFKYESQENTTATDSKYNNTVTKTITDTDTNTSIMTSSSINLNSNDINTNSIYSKENSSVNLKIFQIPIAQKQQETATIEQQEEETDGTNPASSTARSVELVESLLPSQNFTTVNNTSTIEEVLDVLQDITDLLLNHNSSEVLPVEEESSNNEDSELAEIQSEIQMTDLVEQSNADDSDIKSAFTQIFSSETQNTNYVEPLFTSLIENVYDMLKLNLNLNVSKTELRRIFSYLQYKYKNSGNITTDTKAFTDTVNKTIIRTNTNSSTNMSINSTFNEEKVSVIQSSSQFLKNPNLLKETILNNQNKQSVQTHSKPDFQETLKQEKPKITSASFLTSSESGGIKNLLSSLISLDQEYHKLQKQKVEKLKTRHKNQGISETYISNNSQLLKRLQTTHSNNIRNNMRKNSSATLQMSEDMRHNFEFIDRPSTFAERFKLTEVKDLGKYEKDETSIFERLRNTIGKLLKPSKGLKIGRAVDPREPTVEMGNFALIGFNDYLISGVKTHKKSATIYEITWGIDIGPLMVVPANPIQTSRSEEPPIARFTMQMDLTFEANVTVDGEVRRLKLKKVELDRLRNKNIEMIPQCFQNDSGSLKFTDLFENSVNSMKFDEYFTKILEEILRESEPNLN